MKTKLNHLLTKSSMALLLFISPYAFASSGNTKIDEVLQNFLDYITSGPAHIIALLAIVGAGFATFKYGKLSKEKFMAIVIAVGIIFGSSDILNMLGVS